MFFLCVYNVFGPGGFFRRVFSGRIQDTHFDHPNATSQRNTTSGLAYMVIASYAHRPRPADLNETLASYPGAANVYISKVRPIPRTDGLK